VQDDFDAYLKCGRLEAAFLRVRCEQCHAEKLVAFSCKRRGRKKAGQEVYLPRVEDFCHDFERQLK
jgi:hypothetical protein